MSKSKLHVTVVALAVGTLLLGAPPARAAKTNVAVFNFQMKSATPQWKWLEKYLADRIATDFFQDRHITVTARDEMQILAQKLRWVPELATTDPERMKQIHRQLRIEHIVSGVYTVHNGKLTITAQIVHVESRKELARKVVSGKADDVLTLQRQLSAELLNWFTKRPAEQILPTLPVWTRSLPAARALYEGMDLYDQGRYAQAWLRFRRAAREDPAYVEAQYWVGKMYYFTDRYAHARRALEKFVYLDQTHPRMRDALTEYVHTYEDSHPPVEDLLELYANLEKRFGDVLGRSWLDAKCAIALSRAGRYRESIARWGPPLQAVGAGNPSCVLNVAAHNLATAETLGRKQLVHNAQYFSSYGHFWRIKEGTNEIVRMMNLPGQPVRILGEKHRNIDKDALFCKPWTDDQTYFILAAPSGHVFKAIRFYPIAEGDDGILEVGLGRLQHAYQVVDAVRSEPLAVARGKGVLWDKLPPCGYFKVTWRIRVKDVQHSRPILVRGIKAVAELEKVGQRGSLYVDCLETPDFRVDVDGIPARWFPGRIGLLKPGPHVLKFLPSSPGTLYGAWTAKVKVEAGKPTNPGSPYGTWTTKVIVKAGKTTKVVGRLPWSPDSPWSKWTSLPVPRPETGHIVGGHSAAPGLWLDEQGIRLVWSRANDLWSAFSSDGVAFSPPRKLDLPVSSAWLEKSPRILRDESGRYVLTFLSDRNARHSLLPYACWSRDFGHWSAPTMIAERPGYFQDLLQDDRGRYILALCDDMRGFGSASILSSRDAYHWTVMTRLQMQQEPNPGWDVRDFRILQRDDGSYELYVLAQRMIWGINVVDGKKIAGTIYLLRWTSRDLTNWGRPETIPLGYRRYRTAPTPCIAPLHRRGRTVLPCFDYDRNSFDSKAALLLEQPGGGWELTQPVPGLICGLASAAHHRRWGYVIAWIKPGGTRAAIHPAYGPYVIRGSDLRGPFGPAQVVQTTISRPSSAPPRPGPAKAAGELTYSPRNPTHPRVLDHDSAGATNPEQFSEPAKDAGTASPKAFVASFKAGGRDVKVAIDSTDPASLHPNVALLDLTGKGDFKNAYRIKIRKASRINWGGVWYSYRFEQERLDVQAGSLTIPAYVKIIYNNRDSGKALGLTLGTQAQGTCLFGGKRHQVKLFDGNNNLRLDDAPGPKLAHGKVVGVRGGDLIVVDGNIEGFPGHPIRVNGEFYKVKVSSGGSKVSASRFQGPMGRLHINHPAWKAWLIGKKHMVILSGGSDPVPIPADVYSIVDYSERSSAKVSGSRAEFCLRKGQIDQKARVAAGETAEVAIGSPLKGTLSAERVGDDIRFTLEWKDVTGAPGTVRRASGQAQAFKTPLLTVLDAQGKQVMKRNMQKSWFMWSPPQHLRGAFTVKVSPPEYFQADVPPVTLVLD